MSQTYNLEICLNVVNRDGSEQDFHRIIELPFPPRTGRLRYRFGDDDEEGIRLDPDFFCYDVVENKFIGHASEYNQFDTADDAHAFWTLCCSFHEEARYPPPEEE